MLLINILTASLLLIYADIKTASQSLQCMCVHECVSQVEVTHTQIAACYESPNNTGWSPTTRKQRALFKIFPLTPAKVLIQTEK